MKLMTQAKEVVSGLAETRDQLASTSTDVKTALNAAVAAFICVAAVAVTALIVAVVASHKGK